MLPVDLRADWRGALVAAGHDLRQPTAWLVEGLLIYLTAAEAKRLLADITRAAHPARVTALWKGGLGKDTLDWLNGHGWAAQIHDRAIVAAALGRPDQGASGSGFITAVQQ
ncbi:MAG: class I SAM-dependent methyltransferase [Jatrophihabitantaceae bacterium]